MGCAMRICAICPAKHKILTSLLEDHANTYLVFGHIKGVPGQFSVYQYFQYVVEEKGKFVAVPAYCNLPALFGRSQVD